MSEFDDIVKRLVGVRDAAIKYTAYTRYICVNSEAYRKFDNSRAGNICQLHNVTCQSCLILFCAKVWEGDHRKSTANPNPQKSTPQSIPHAARALDTLGVSKIWKNASKEQIEQFSQDYAIAYQ
ncbi:hypothetical protein [Algirhabdus cladophorae]|uniref:hypothetical protein n=1 Tax=Algirhabdus cladophorae TaxID=3377108 RepID=UPI003B849C55